MSPAETVAGETIASARRFYAISELAAEFEVTPRTIRFYEDRNLLAPRRAGRNRIFSHQDRARLILILRGKRLGFSLAEIKRYLDFYRIDPDQTGQIALLLSEVRARIGKLERQLGDIDQTLVELRDIEARAGASLRARGADTTVGT
ncbi:MAG: MerR family transcriptional regulator [Alphaproteobacteria bacterium]